MGAGAPQCVGLVGGSPPGPVGPRLGPGDDCAQGFVPQGRSRQLERTWPWRWGQSSHHDAGSSTYTGILTRRGSCDELSAAWAPCGCPAHFPGPGSPGSESILSHQHWCAWVSSCCLHSSAPRGDLRMGGLSLPTPSLPMVPWRVRRPRQRCDDSVLKDTSRVSPRSVWCHTPPNLRRSLQRPGPSSSGYVVQGCPPHHSTCVAKEVTSVTFCAELVLKASSQITSFFPVTEASNTPDGGDSVSLVPGMRTSHQRVPNQPKVIIWEKQARRKPAVPSPWQVESLSL